MIAGIKNKILLSLIFLSQFFNTQGITVRRIIPLI